jgi:signal transduction histidine kinase
MKIIKWAENSNHCIALTIEDTGIGFSEKDKMKIFDAYFRGENSTSTEGEGIGLYVVKGNVDKLNGSISVETSIGRGSKFIIEFPKTFME